MHESIAPDELDLALLESLQRAPRAPWALISQVLDVAPITLARRWDRLRDAGLAWVSATPGPAFQTVGVTAFVLMWCRPRLRENLAVRLQNDPSVATLEITGGAPDLAITVFSRSLYSLHESVLSRLGRYPGVDRVEVSIVTTLYGEGSRWRLRALDTSQVGRLASVTSRDALDRREMPQLDSVDRDLLDALVIDGRMAFQDLGARAGVTPATARRRVSRLVDSGVVRVRCDLAAPVFGWPISATIWGKVPANRLQEVCRSLAGSPQVRVAAATTGSNNLMATCWLHSLGEIEAVEANLLERFPFVVVSNRVIDLRSVKRMGRILGENGRAADIVPLRPWTD
ncbi:Lrp/AsnC family transcriptional regulator [Arthrobacter sp. AZCC_0090]|uniref:Lrp/AsnC family transcriptional regulator n=1 Tax=unclassified Arthrobacter TaxID=235627 RepID=UPI001618CE3A|nr:DNA-binding Lrp family transcriptional regulator [Arthrobacter sp. AZCC_0090]